MENKDIMDLVDAEISSETVTKPTEDKKEPTEAKEVKAPKAPKKKVEEEKTTTSKKFNTIEDLKAKFDTESIDKLRKMDFLNQYVSKLPTVEIEGFATSWICDTPNNAYRAAAVKEGWIKADLEEYPSVASGYADETGEDRYAHHLMVIPKEIYDRKQKAVSSLTNKMYGHILDPNSEREDIQGDGMYNPGNRKMQTVNKVLENK